MTIFHLNHLFAPKSVAVIGASDREGSVGRVVLANAIAAGFPGDIWPVNPKYDEVQGLKCYQKIADLPSAPDLAVIMTPPNSVPAIIAELAAKGTPTAAVLTAGINDKNGLRPKMLEAARASRMRIVGPNTLGVIAPAMGVDLSFSHMAPEPGKLALLSQSGAIATSLIDWAADEGIGFSHVLSLGDMADVDIGDCLDYLAMDGRTRAILLYIESVPDPRKFISAARAAARLKPVIAIKPGRYEEAAKAAATHTGALSGADDVVDAALTRAGVLRVKTLAELFDAAETVARFPALNRARVGIVTNGGGAGVLAVDKLIELGCEMAEISPETTEQLNTLLPGTWSHANPVDIIGDAPPERYSGAVKAVAADPNVDAILVMNCPTALANPVEAATAIAELVDTKQVHGKPVLTCWLGEHAARPAREILQASGIANFDTPEEAARAVALLSEWSDAQKQLLRVPSGHPDPAKHNTEKVHEILKSVASEGRSMLTEPEAKSVLAAYGVPVPEIEVGKTPDEVEQIAGDMLAKHKAVVVKLVSREISHKSDIGGVVLNLSTPEVAKKAAEDIYERVAATGQADQIDGYAVQPMIKMSKSHEVIIGMSRDPVFGPVMLFGAGGTAVEVLKDTAIALPPLDEVLAADLIDRTRVSKLLAGYRDEPAADRDAIISAITATTQLVIDFPGLKGIDINPLIASPSGVMALDARIEVDPERATMTRPNKSLAIRPYPFGWEKDYVSELDASFHIRPILPGDANYLDEFFEAVTSEDMRLRYLSPHKVFTGDALRRLTQIDYDREMAFVAISADDQLGGVARISADADHTNAEFSILVRSDQQGHGLGRALFEQLISYARADGIIDLEGLILSENIKMLALCKEFGFKLKREPDEPGLMHAELNLKA